MTLFKHPRWSATLIAFGAPVWTAIACAVEPTDEPDP
jgi:hypothetical protein